ncbi:hypothetical protein Vadar_028823 [Vaccinium darrowii]|uniref:Uncharacterized protein n=1 Tax=Vaccinium darrowii TaxID=229202 RepID=A0ACB7ZNB1_9ERIC|nr:hypothetical protein Vadar_028823 [Vaccinium darrowii]
MFESDRNKPSFTEIQSTNSTRINPSKIRGRDTSSVDGSVRSSSSREADHSGELSVSNASDLKIEWVEQDVPGVYITIRSLPGGTRELQCVLFSSGTEYDSSTEFVSEPYTVGAQFTIPSRGQQQAYIPCTHGVAATVTRCTKVPSSSRFAFCQSYAVSPIPISCLCSTNAHAWVFLQCLVASLKWLQLPADAWM